METIGRMRNKKERKEEKMERWRRKKLGAQVPLQYFLKKKRKRFPSNILLHLPLHNL